MYDAHEDALETLAEHMAGYRGATREPRALVDLVDVETNAIVVEVAAPPGTPATRYRLRVTVEELTDPEPCPFEIRPARLFLPPAPAEECGEDAAPGSEFCRAHLGAAA
jgi:hypothetical protein